MFRIALRNVLRNKRRTLLGLCIIVVSIVVVFIALGYVQELYHILEKDQIIKYGHFQIASEGFWDRKIKERRLLGPEDIEKIKEILKGKEEIIDYTTTLGFSGIFGTEENSTPVMVEGVELNAEQLIRIESGTDLSNNDGKQILVGKGVKEALNLEIDEWASIITENLQGDFSAQSLKVTGSYTTGTTQLDNVSTLVPLAFAQKILKTDGVDKIKVTLRENNLNSEMMKEINKDFKTAGLEVDLKSWFELADYFRQIVAFFNMISFFIVSVIFVLVFFGILNLTSMSFFERMKEIGTIRAIGTTANQVFLQLLQEALILGIIGGIIGVASSYGLGRLINFLDISYMPPDLSVEIPFNISINMKNAIIPFVLTIITTSISALYPAIKASRLNVVETIIHT